MSLEGLPLEIKVMIMSRAPDIETLHNITRASPEYHSAFRGAKEEIFNNITVETLSSVCVDILESWSAAHAPHLNLDTPDREKIILDVLRRYYKRLPKYTRNTRLEVAESLAILRLHRKIAAVIARYCKQNLTYNPLDGQVDAVPPSASELHRLYRAAYRYELYSRLFGAGPGGVNTSIYHIVHTLDEDQIAEIFFGLFPIHEVEEIACLHKFASDHYDGKKVPKNLASLGPTYLDCMLKTSTRPEWLPLLSEFPLDNNITSLRRVLDAYERVVDTGTWYWRGMEDEPSEERKPTKGWVWASKRGIQNVDFKLRRWGYVFWDEERLRRWNIDEERMLLNYPWTRK
ncbi:hypothetical protein P7C71_g2148, partial [Lecanoromycetidae sp. Uapishka_2]